MDGLHKNGNGIPRKNKKEMVEIKNTVKEVKNPSMVSSVGLNV